MRIRIGLSGRLHNVQAYTVFPCKSVFQDTHYSSPESGCPRYCLTRPDKQGKVAATEPPILRKLGLTHSQWHQQMLGTETRYWRAIGSAQFLIEKAAAIGQQWLKGIGSAEMLMRPQPT